MGESITDGTLAKFLKGKFFSAYFSMPLFTNIFNLVVHECKLLIVCASGILRTGPGDRVELDEPIAQIETDKVIPLHSCSYFIWKLSYFLMLVMLIFQ